jgi:hypothetical protein
MVFLNDLFRNNNLGKRIQKENKPFQETEYMNVQELIKNASRNALVILVVMLALEELLEAGLMIYESDKALNFTDQGRKNAIDLLAIGFEPTAEEKMNCLSFLKREFKFRIITPTERDHGRLN